MSNFEFYTEDGREFPIVYRSNGRRITKWYVYHESQDDLHIRSLDNPSLKDIISKELMDIEIFSGIIESYDRDLVIETLREQVRRVLADAYDYDAEVAKSIANL